MPKCEIYKDMNGKWRWRRTSKDGKIKDYSGRAFDTREECEKHGKEEGTCSSYKRV